MRAWLGFKRYELFGQWGKVLVITVFLLTAWVTAPNCGARTIYVDVNGPNEPGSGTAFDPFRRINDAVYDANSADVIEIQPGIYTGPGNFCIDPAGKGVIIKSVDPDDWDIVASTIIDPDHSDLAFYIHSGEDASCLIQGLTIKNAHANGSGGAINCDHSSPTIEKCMILGNSAVWSGGGIYCSGSNSTIRNCIIAGNSAHEGGAVRCTAGSEVSILNCTVAGNIADLQGGGIYCFGSILTIKNTIVWANSAPSGGQLALPVSSGVVSEVSVSYSDVELSGEAVYDPCDCLIWGSGNIEADPCFVSFESSDPAELWDLHLCSEAGRWDVNSQTWLSDSQSSCCIDAGEPNSVYDGETWPHGKVINIGAYGGTVQASMSGNRADFDIDGTADFVDYSFLANKWMMQEGCIEDLNFSSNVDFADLLLFAENWLWRH